MNLEGPQKHMALAILGNLISFAWTACEGPAGKSDAHEKKGHFDAILTILDELFAF